ncbi:PhnB protein [Pseudoduganella lurida]|uniref:PhnB protein n=1 Tax=Pseudoduganella lurida TaxID=1036180 RepID=A0A562R8L7_9BURK|nr:VOC family protein [Pseudoduganella lurida]TWI65419.1 PhnB protein [Pseudoduganella lurida]
MSIQTVTHLNFRGQARAALAFYQRVFGGDVTVVTYGDFGRAERPEEADQVIWGQVAADNGFRVMAYDVPAAMPYHAGENAFFVSVRGDAEEEIRALWDKLSEGGTVVHALAPSQWSPLYGMLKDQFGVMWVLDVAAPYRG